MTVHRLAPSRWGHLLARALYYLRQDGLLALLRRSAAILGPRLLPWLFGYGLWQRVYQRPTSGDRRAIRRHMERFAVRPLFSVVVIGRPPSARLLDSLEAQLYRRWELCPAADPASALASAKGDYLVLLDGDETLVPYAFYLAAAWVNDDPDIDLLYGDEDAVDGKGRRTTPFFKPDWSPDLFLGWDYLGSGCIVRRSRAMTVGGLSRRLPAVARYDLLLRLLDGSPPPRIAHIPWILLHREAGGAAGVDREAVAEQGRQAVIEHCLRIGLLAEVCRLPGRDGQRRLIHPVTEPVPWVSAIIPTRDRVDLLRQCVDGLLDATDYPRLEIVIVDNGSSEPATLSYLAAVAARGVTVRRDDGPFNYAALNNRAVAEAKGEVILLLNNDIKVIHGDWLREMVGQALRPDVGAVGAKLYFPDDTLQHGGVVIGLGGVAGHLHHAVPGAASGDHDDLRLVREVSAVTAACLALRKQVFEEVGGLDADRLAVAFNDVDLCLKICRQGYRIIWTPFAELYHFESASRGSDLAPDKIERFQREHRTMVELWGDALSVDPYYNPNRTQDGCDGGLAYPPRLVKPWRPPSK
ncbi:glycosyltransferase family 2 protein [Telmatospirillum sp.]|uniref:glycosyltransferase family 2 protein n=1 Tax=Telmatospirillum sp. TaxID=2079197 RepID=UPI00283D890F|nr:glycosyltransferase family 2 protein [Telmatospirillum sp.]MDR3439723.1 glycosyltransferase family 2 protein [Telmatospirillum sp.]